MRNVDRLYFPHLVQELIDYNPYKQKMMKEQIKELRVKIDGLAQLTKELKPIQMFNKLGYIGERSRVINTHNSKEIEKAVDSLYLAKAWLGKVLGELGSESPYPKDGTRKTINDIEPTADKSQILTTTGLEGVATSQTWKEKNHIEKVDWLRQEILQVDGSILQYTQEYQKRWIAVYSLRCDQYLLEARFWLGFELERIREDK